MLRLLLLKKKQNLLLAADAALFLEARRERDKDGLLVGAYTHGARLLAIATVEKQIAFPSRVFERRNGVPKIVMHKKVTRR